MEKDLQKKGYFDDPERYADLINGIICSGREVVLLEMKQRKEMGGKKSMCGAIAGMVQDGIDQGKEQGAKALIETCQEFGQLREATADRIMVKLELSEEVTKRYMEQYWH